MSETAPSDEILTPGARFVRLIDGHFDAIGGAGASGGLSDTGEEQVHLLSTDSGPLLGYEPRMAWAFRPIPGLEAMTAHKHLAGHRVGTYSEPTPRITKARTYFVRNEVIWLQEVPWHTTSMGTRRLLHPDAELIDVPLNPEQTESFLDWLARAIPVLPMDPDSSPG